MKIFVQIASYRDPQLPLTLQDALDKAKTPSNVEFCVAHQYDDSEDVSKYEKMDNMNILKVPYKEAKGACWARNLIQQEYNGEDFTLQLDSHHRFQENWDETLIEMVSQLQNAGHAKPLLTSYIASFEIDAKPEEYKPEVWKMNFDRFTPEGVLLFLPATLEGADKLTEPVPARFYSGHFTFTLGEHAQNVQHDPNYYFHGEEISLAVRSFTHGYDLFHPHKHIAWHEYTRSGRPKHWDDSSAWGKLNADCQARNRQLLGMDAPTGVDFGKYGLGVERTIDDYERYAGVRFKDRSVQQHTLDNKLAPNPHFSSDQDYHASFLNRFRHCIDIGYEQVPETDYDFWAVAFHAEDDTTLDRCDAHKDEIAGFMSDPDKYCKIWREFQTKVQPKYWVVWPHSESKGWCDKIHGNLR